jgi:hypothetical protein
MLIFHALEPFPSQKKTPSPASIKLQVDKASKVDQPIFNQIRDLATCT